MKQPNTNIDKDSGDISWTSSDSDLDSLSFDSNEMQTRNTSLKVSKKINRKRMISKNLCNLSVTVSAAQHSSCRADCTSPIHVSKPQSPVIRQVTSKNQPIRGKDHGKPDILTTFDKLDQIDSKYTCPALKNDYSNNYYNSPPSPVLSSSPNLNKLNHNKVTGVEMQCEHNMNIKSPDSHNIIYSNGQNPALAGPYLFSNKKQSPIQRVHLIQEPEQYLQDSKSQKTECTTSDVNISLQNDAEVPRLDPTSPILNVKIKSHSQRRFKKKLRMGNVEPDNVAINTCTREKEKRDSLSPILKTKRNNPDLISPPPEAIVKKIKSYFEDQFSSQSTSRASIHDSTSQSQIPDSQVSIGECASQKVASSEIDILESNSPAISQESGDIIISVSSDRSESKNISDVSSTSKVSVLIKTESDESLPRKRRRYKRGGLASRLQELLKNRKNQLSLWRHEMYLASNSNFVVPSTSPRVFGIKKINHDYGSYLVEAVDLANEQDYLILLSLEFGCNMIVMENSILKLYEPYEVIDNNSQRFIINACKFECVNVKEEK